MEIRLIFLSQLEVTNCRMLFDLIGLIQAAEQFQEIAPAQMTVPQTDTGGLVEYTKAIEKMMLKELGKIPP